MNNEQVTPPLTSSDALQEKLTEQGRLAKFFAKLFHETLHLAGDSISFSREGDQLNGLLKRGGEELKSISLKSGWFDPLWRWLYDRRTSFFSNPDTPLEQSQSDDYFECALYLGDATISMLVERRLALNRKNSLTLSRFNVMPRARAIELLMPAEQIKSNLSRCFADENGMIVLTNRDGEALQKSVSVTLALSHALYVGTLENQELLQNLQYHSEGALLIGTVRAEEPLVALLTLRQHGADFKKLRIKAVLTQEIVRRVCQSCARETTPDSKFLKQMPSELSTLLGTSYRIGRGCASCGQSGLRGFTAVQSLAMIYPQVLPLIEGGADEQALLQILYPLGLRGLQEDALYKVGRNIISFDSAFTAAPNLPDVYLKFIRSHRRPRETEILISSEESFANDIALPKQARSTSSAHGGDDNQPLFDPKPKTVNDSKPLVLVVEDDADQRRILDMVFRSANYEVQVAENGARALDRLDKSTILPDLIVTDVMMPELDGTELVRQLKTSSRYKKLPVLVLTVLNDSDREYALLDVGADDYCEKTIQRKVLLKRVENLLKRSRRGN